MKVLNKIILSFMGFMVSLSLISATIVELHHHKLHHQDGSISSLCLKQSDDNSHHGCNHKRCFICNLHLDKAFHIHSHYDHHDDGYDMICSCGCFHCLTIQSKFVPFKREYRPPLPSPYIVGYKDVRGSPMVI